MIYDIEYTHLSWIYNKYYLCHIAMVMIILVISILFVIMNIIYVYVYIYAYMFFHVYVSLMLPGFAQACGMQAFERS